MILKVGTQYKKDLKRYQNKPSKIAALKEVLKHAEYKPHMLSGKLNGFMECHVEDDFLLIWIDAEANVIKLVRLGTHHELFGK